ncbi:MAG: hypothetical protein AAFQ41_11275 [Cyanobacteria bacterium J06623_7]
MGWKQKIIGLAIAFTLGLTVANLATDSWLSWQVGTIKSDLWAFSQRFEPDFTSSKTAASDSEMLTAGIFPPPTETSTETDDIFARSNFFPLGWYDSVDNLATPARIANEGIDFIVPYTGKSDVKAVRAYLDRAAAAGMKVMVEIPRLEVRRDHRWLIAQFVRALKNHPAVYGWYLFDEPEFMQISPRLLKRVYGAIKAEDPQHTVAICFGKLKNVREYLPALDTAMYFRYPCYADSANCGFADGSFREFITEAAAVSQEEDNFWLVLQGYGEDKYGKPRHNRQLPSRLQERYMIYTAVLGRVNGLLFWTHYLSQPQWIEGVLTPLLAELKGYLPAIMNYYSAVPQAVASEAQIQTEVFRHPQTGALLLVAINHSDRDLTPQIQLQPRIGVNSARVMTEDRELTLEAAGLTDRFAPFTVHIYQLEARN